jgi:hypothetical protein
MQFNGFDATQVEPNAVMEPIPAGWYKAVIVGSEEAKILVAISS